jgi:hypothetical protein
MKELRTLDKKAKRWIDAINQFNKKLDQYENDCKEYSGCYFWKETTYHISFNAVEGEQLATIRESGQGEVEIDLFNGWNEKVGDIIEATISGVLAEDIYVRLGQLPPRCKQPNLLIKRKNENKESSKKM